MNLLGLIFSVKFAQLYHLVRFYVTLFSPRVYKGISRLIDRRVYLLNCKCDCRGEGYFAYLLISSFVASFCDVKYDIWNNNVTFMSPGEFPSSSVKQCAHRCEATFYSLYSPNLSSDAMIQVYVMNDLCFCANRTVEIATCPLANPCVVTSTTCPIQVTGRKVIQANKVDVDFELVVADLIESDVPTKIRVLSNTGLSTFKILFLGQVDVGIDFQSQHLIVIPVKYSFTLSFFLIIQTE